jgi:CheY-like chemotaxis protein
MGDAPVPRRPVVLVVSDEPRALSALSAFLRVEGFAPFPAEGAHAALAALRGLGGEVDAALVDLHAPGRGGAEACRLLREARPGLRCWLISEGGEGPPGGPEGVLVRPFTLAQLRDCLAAVRAGAEAPPGQGAPG